MVARAIPVPSRSPLGHVKSAPLSLFPYFIFPLPIRDQIKVPESVLIWGGLF